MTSPAPKIKPLIAGIRVLDGEKPVGPNSVANNNILRMPEAPAEEANSVWMRNCSRCTAGKKIQGKDPLGPA